jgi:hypothetical protein
VQWPVTAFENSEGNQQMFEWTTGAALNPWTVSRRRTGRVQRSMEPKVPVISGEARVGTRNFLLSGYFVLETLADVMV